MKRKFLTVVGFATGIVAGSVDLPPLVREAARARRRLLRRRLDGLVRRRLARGGEAPARRRRRARRRTAVTATDPLAAALVEHAYLEGDFLLRSGKRSRYYLDKYRFETRPELLRPLGERIAAIVREHAPDATRLAAPELGAVALAAAASLDSGLPFLIVRKEAKEYGTGNRLEGPYERRRVRLPRRGRRHLGRRAARVDRGAARGGSRRAHRGLRRRPGRGGSRRARPRGGSAPAALPRGRAARAREIAC